MTEKPTLLSCCASDCWADNPDALCDAVKRYCKRHHCGFHTACPRCLEEARHEELERIRELLETIVWELKALALKP